MKILLFTILLTLAIIHDSVGQVEYIYSDIRCEEEQRLTQQLYNTNLNNRKQCLNILSDAEKAVAKEPDIWKATGSLVRIYQMYEMLGHPNGQNRCIQKMMHIAETSGDNEIFVRANILQAYSLIHGHDLDEAIKCYQNAIKYLQPKKAYKQMAKLHCFAAYAYENANNEALCLRNVLEAVSIVENECNNDPLLMGEVYLHTAIIYLKQRDFTKANGYITGALMIFNRNKDSENKMYRNFYNTALIVDADIKLTTNRFDSTKYDMAIELYKKGINSIMNTEWYDNSARNSLKYLSDGHNGLGIAYQCKKNDTAAIKNMMTALQIRKNLRLQDKITDSYITIGEYYAYKKMPDSVYYYNVKGFNLAQDIKDYRLVARSASNLAKHFALQDNYKKAYKYTNLAKDAYFMVSDKDKVKQIAREEMEYLFDQERTMLQNNKESQDEIIKRDERIIKWAIAFVAMSAISLTVIVILFIKKKKKNQLLREQRDALEERSQELLVQQEEISQKNQELRATTEMLEESNKELRNATQKLEESNHELQMLSAVAAMTSNSIFITNKDGDFIWFNDAFSRETRIPIDQLHTHPALKKSAMTPETKNVYDRVLATKKPLTYTAEMKHLNRPAFWVHSAVTPILNDKGDIDMIVWVSTDVTELHSAYEKIEDQNKEINASIAYARRIQDAVQPMKIFSDEILGDHFVINMPRNIVSGDFHWVGYKNGLSIFTVSDCTGHGVPGAFISMLGQVMLNQTLNKLDDITAANILNIMRTGIIHQLHQRDKDGVLSDSMDASMFVYNREQCIIDYAGAYSHAYILRFGTPDTETMTQCEASGSKIVANDEGDAYLIRLKPNRMTIGIDRRDTIPFTSTKFKVSHGDIAYATTDGYPDQFGGDKQKRLNIATFEKILLQYCHLSMEDQRKQLEKTFLEWKGDYEQTDDVHVLGIVL